MALLVAIDAQVAQFCGKWQKIDGNRLLYCFINMFGYLNTAFACRKIVFLLAGHLAGMATGAILIVYQQSILRHGRHSL